MLLVLHEQRYIFCLQVQLFQNIVIHGLHTVRPVGIAIVGFTLMQQDTLDNVMENVAIATIGDVMDLV